MSLILVDVKFTYMKKTPFERLALDNVSLEIPRGQITGIIGHTGSGKSTLIQHLNGLLKPDSGQVKIDGTGIGDKSEAAKKARRRVGIVFQYPEQQLFEETVEKDISYGPLNYGVDIEGVRQRVREALELVGLDYARFANRSPFTLSGGQMRRVAMAGIIALKPEYLVLDEPTAGLDPRTRKEILARITALQRHSGCAVIMISHNMDEIAEHCSQVIVMNKGRIVKDGKTKEVFCDEAALKATKLEQPEVMKLLIEARKRKFPVEQYAINRSQCLQEMLAAYRRKNA